MQMRLLGVAAALVALLVVTAAAAEAGSGGKRYTFAAAQPTQLSPTGTLTVVVPSEWRVHTSWALTRIGDRVSGGPPYALDPVHKSVGWTLESVLMKPGTTLAEMRHTMLRWSGTPIWGKGSGIRVMVGDTYLRMPLGKVWRYTLKLIPPKGLGQRVSYVRYYVLDRGIARALPSHIEKQLFTRFTVVCVPPECGSHNDQLAALMRSIRITP